MQSYVVYALLCFICACNATVQYESIKWAPCDPQNGSVPLSCGTLKVPLDYTDPSSNATIDIFMVKVNAIKQPKKGTIIFNPGGPGFSGRDFVAGRQAGNLLLATGGAHDLIGFDTRGTGYTLPFSCYDSELNRTLIGAGDAGLINSSDTATGTLYSQKTVFVSQCNKTAKAVGPYISTAFIARDMMRITDALNEGGLLKYWGFSYGTALAEHAAALFPDRMDKVILDGVLNPLEYSAGLDVEQISRGDDALEGFFKSCFQTPDNCLLSKVSKSPEELLRNFYGLLYDIKFNPRVVDVGGEPSLVTYTILKAAISESLYATSRWPQLATGIHGLLTGNKTQAGIIAALLIGVDLSGSRFENLGPESVFGIRCSDVALRASSLAELRPVLDKTLAASKLMGDIQTGFPLVCSQWPFTPKERYSGNYQVKTKNPMLFIGNTYDHLTPYESALNASLIFEGSVALQQNSFGHASLGQPSLCTAKVVRAYFDEGKLPAAGTKCEPDALPFENKTLTEILAPLNVTKRALGLADDDARLMAAVAQLGNAMAEMRRAF